MDEDDKESVSSYFSAGKLSILDSVMQKTASFTRFGTRSGGSSPKTPTNEKKIFFSLDDPSWQQYKNSHSEVDDVSLHALAFRGEMQKILLAVSEDPGIDLNESDEMGCTPFHLAAFACHLELCESLVTLGADLTKVDSLGRTALHLASHEGHFDIISMLVSQVRISVLSFQAEPWV